MGFYCEKKLFLHYVFILIMYSFMDLLTYLKQYGLMISYLTQ